MKTGSMAWRAARSLSSPSRPRRKAWRRHSTRIKEYSAPRRKRLLVVEDNPAEQLSIRELLGHDDIDVTVAATGAEALEPLSTSNRSIAWCSTCACPTCPASKCWNVSATRRSSSDLPVVVFTGKELSPEEDARLHTLARSVVVKGVESPSGCWTKPRCSCIAWSPTCRPRSRRCSTGCTVPTSLVGKKVLVVDDDVRNIFALSSVLERRGMTVLTAGTGREAIATLESTPDVAIVLMDIMMPEMDGYETMQVIRQNPAFRRLPIIALTAKAMKGDREKCLEAGASEYLAKPVNTEQLLSALRMWLHR